MDDESDDEEGSFVDEEAVELVIRASACVTAGRCADAVALYAAAFKCDGSLRDGLKEEFCAAVQRLSDEQEEEAGEAWVRLWVESIRVSPDNDLLYMGLARAAYARGADRQARAAFQAAAAKSVSLESRDLAIECARRVGARLIESWHFRMVNDVVRNAAFDDALRRALVARSGARRCRARVLDIGAGTGLLSLAALKHGAGRVTACERSAAMCDVARATLAANGGSQVELLNADSLSLPDDDRYDVVVAEVVDAALFGEGCLRTLLDASDRLLKKPGGTIIPASARLFGVAVRCDALRAEMRHGDEIRSRDSYGVTTLSSLRDVTRLSTVFAFGGTFGLLEVARTLRLEGASGTGVAEGEVDAIVVWFELDCDAHNCISTAPDQQGTASSWQQAVFAVPGSPRIKVGSELRVEACLRPTEMCDVLRLSLQVDGEVAVDEEPTDCNLGDADISRLNDARFRTAHRDAVRSTGAKRILEVGFGPSWPITQYAPDATVVACLGADEFSARDQSTAMPTLLSVAERFATGDEGFDAVSHCLVDASGLMRAGALTDLDLAKRLLRGGANNIAPNKARLVGRLVESKSLAESYYVTSTQLGFDLRPLNEYSTPHARDINLADHADLVSLSDESTLLHLDFEMSRSIESAAAEPVTLEVECGRTGTAHALLFWWDLGYFENEISTLTDHSHWRCAAYMIAEGNGISVRENATLSIEVVIRNSQVNVLSLVSDDDSESEDDDSDDDQTPTLSPD